MYTWKDLETIVAKLRSEDGCPWDREQTHESLKSCLQNECQEVMEAIDKGDMATLCEELGDLLFNIVLQCRIGEEEGVFTMAEVINGASEKMIRRHPFVFEEKKTLSPQESQALWKEIKLQEKSKKP